jgi:DNA-binding transcriptional LysR family regulator
VEPTTAGKILLEHAERVLGEAHLLRQRFAQRRNSHEGGLIFGIIPTIAPYLLPRLLGPYRKAFPKIDVQVREARTSGLIQQVVDGSIEFAILSDVTPQDQKKWSLHVRELFREPLLLALPLEHPLADASQAPKPEQLQPESLIHLRGGHCLTDDWLGNAQDKKHFRDVSARVEGPVVQQLQSAFSENWIEETGDVIAGECYFPKLEPRGDIQAHAVFVSPSGTPSMVKLLHYLVIHSAKKQLLIQNPYFLPDPDGRKALLDAARRGVDVRVMIPAATATDAPIVQHASHHHYGTLLKGGVRIFEYQRTLLHQKLFTVDGCWAAVGSTNFDDRAFEINDEVSFVIYDEGIAQQLEAIFEDDLKDSKEMAFEPWKNRPVLHKLQDFGAFLFNEQL